MLNQLQREDFTPHLEQPFEIELDEGENLTVELAEVSDLGPESSREDGRRSFSVLFRGPKDAYLEQRIYKVRHPEMGELDLFLVPLGNDKEGMCFEAVFS